MKNNFNVIACAFSLIAVSYGLARFAFGLLLPQIREELLLDLSTAGWIGSGAFVAYCVGIVSTFHFSKVCSPRAMAFTAGLCATIGMAAVAYAASAWVLGFGIALAGLSTGLASPPLASVVSLRFANESRPKANTIINSGTAVGIIFSGLASLAAFSSWRQIYAVFALVSALVTFWVWHSMPKQLEPRRTDRFSFDILRRPGLTALCASAFMMGLSSTAVWTFGSNILRGEFGFTERDIAWTWVALGIAGTGSVFTGFLTGRFGLALVQRWSLMGVSFGIIGLTATAMGHAFGLITMAIFGAAYIICSGTYLIQGIDLFPDRPDLGVGIPFLIMAVRQSMGSPLFGEILEGSSMLTALGIFAAAAFAASLIRYQPK